MLDYYWLIYGQNFPLYHENTISSEIRRINVTVIILYKHLTHLIQNMAI